MTLLEKVAKLRELDFDMVGYSKDLLDVLGGFREDDSEAIKRIANFVFIKTVDEMDDDIEVLA